MPTPHDRFFRYVFADPAHAAGELRTALPTVLSTQLEWSSLRLLPTNLVDPELAERRADLVFSASLAGREMLVVVLLEHQSRPEAFMPLRLLDYQVGLWHDYRREHPNARRLPPIVPVVVYHGEGGWGHPVAFEDLLDLEGDLLDELRPHVPCFSFVLDDLSVARDDELRTRAMSALGRVALFCLKRSRGGDLADELARWRDLLAEIVAAPNGVAALAAVLSYLLEASATPPARLRALTRSLGPRAEEAYMLTGAQMLREEGRREGRAEGEAKGEAQAILMVLEARGLAVTDAQRTRILGCTDLERLERWVRRAVTVKTAAALFSTTVRRRNAGGLGRTQPRRRLPQGTSQAR
jgi:predicted transposase/invertase (TIGR01784 family)